MFVILCKLSGNNAMHVNGLMSSRKNSNHFTTIYKTWFSHLFVSVCLVVCHLKLDLFLQNAAQCLRQLIDS